MRGAALALVLALAGGAAAFAQAPEVTRSPRADKSVTVTDGPGGARAVYAWPKGRIDATKGVALPGSLGVQWIDDEVARVGGPCGPGCNAAFLVSPRGVLGPFPYLLSIDARARVFAVYDGDASLQVQSLDWPSRVLARRPLPAWCRKLACDFHDGYGAGAYTFSSRGRSATLRFRP